MKNKKLILVFAILNLIGFCLVSGIGFYVFVGGWGFIFYSVIAGIIFAFFQTFSNLFKYLVKNLIASIVFSFVCVFGRVIYEIIKGLYPVDRYLEHMLKTESVLAVYLALFFFSAALIGILTKRFLLSRGRALTFNLKNRSVHNT